jgi:hypothetical protein
VTPRTTGFTSTSTSVAYTLALSNLVSGKDYTVTVDLWEQSDSEFEQPGFNEHTTRTYNFTASGATHSIADTVPVPPDYHSITVNKPKVAYAV